MRDNLLNSRRLAIVLRWVPLSLSVRAASLACHIFCAPSASVESILRVHVLHLFGIVIVAHSVGDNRAERACSAVSGRIPTQICSPPSPPYAQSISSEHALKMSSRTVFLPLPSWMLPSCSRILILVSRRTSLMCSALHSLIQWCCESGAPQSPQPTHSTSDTSAGASVLALLPPCQPLSQMSLLMAASLPS